MEHHLWIQAKQLMIDLTPLGVVLGSISLANVHHAFSIIAIIISTGYTIFKIRKDFFSK